MANKKQLEKSKTLVPALCSPPDLLCQVVESTPSLSRRHKEFPVMNIQGDLFNWPSLVQYQHEKRLKSQPEALSDEGFHGTAAQFGSLAFFISVLNGGVGGL